MWGPVPSDTTSDMSQLSLEHDQAVSDMPIVILKSRAECQVRSLRIWTSIGRVGNAHPEFAKDDLASVKGVVAAVAVSGALWAGIGFAIWAVLP